MRHLLRGSHGRTLRRGYPIASYVGPNGSGKSAAMIWDTLPSLDAGRPVLSTVRLLDYRNPRPCDDPDCTSADHGTHLAAHPLYIPWTRWGQLLEVDHADVLADEVTGVASSRDSQSMPSVISNALNQLRRADVVLRWTAPAWSRADSIIRDCTQAVTFCRGYLPVTVPVEDDDQQRAWRHRRLFKWITYDAQAITAADEMTQGKRAKLKPWVRDFHYGPGSDCFSAYDTFDSVSSLGHVSDHGRCMTCGGRRSAPACSCEDYTAPRMGRARGSAAAARGPRVRGGAAATEPDPSTVVGVNTHDHPAELGPLNLLPVDSGASPSRARRAAVRS